jgi:Uncharacterized protein conserved in bacteria
MHFYLIIILRSMVLIKISGPIMKDFQQHRPILADVITKRQSYLRNYALTNIHEFWAVSVEAFFENPADLKINMPNCMMHYAVY